MSPTTLERPAAQRLLLAVATVLLLIPFLAKPLHIDDPMYLWAAQQIHRAWWDFGGFQVNWYIKTQPAWQINENPPMVSYYMALAAFVVGWSEVGMHTAFLLPAVAVVLGVYEIARRCCKRALLAGLIAVTFPVLLVSATTLMSDVVMMAFFIWAMVCWDKGLRDRSVWLILLGGVLIGGAALSKYFGAAMIPLMLVYGLALRRRPGWWMLGLLIPIAMMVGYEQWTLWLYGSRLMSTAVQYAGNARRLQQSRQIESLVVGLGFMGACLAGVLFYAPMLWSRRALLAGVIAAGAVCVALHLWGNLGLFRTPPALVNSNLDWTYQAQFALWLIVGLGVAALVTAETKRWREPESLLLLTWIFGTFVFATVINWTINGRCLLPLAPPVAILMVRRLEARGWTWRYLAIPLLPAAALSLTVAWADAGAAAAERAAAQKIAAAAEHFGMRIKFQGHWGFQYYMEQLGFHAMEENDPGAQTGDVIVVPTNNSGADNMPPDHWARLGQTLMTVPQGIATISNPSGAGFYSSVYGPLPFVFVKTIPDSYLLFQYHPELLTQPADVNPAHP